MQEDPLAMLETIYQKLGVDESESPSPNVLDAFSFTTPNPGKWPLWTDLAIDVSPVPSVPSKNREEVVRAIHDLCSKVDQMLDRPAYQNTHGSDAVTLRRSQVARIRKRLAMLQDALSSPDMSPICTAIEGAHNKLAQCDLAEANLSILDTFAFRSGKPGLFTTWTELDMSSTVPCGSSRRKEVVAALKDLLSKGEQLLARPACQRALGVQDLEKYRSMMSFISERVAALSDTLSPPNPQPLLSALEEVDRRLNRPDPVTLDSIAFLPKKQGLFIVWTDLDVDSSAAGNANNRGAVIMALDDLLATFDRMVTRPACQKALGATEVERYRAMKAGVEKRLGLIKEALAPARPSPRPLAHPEEPNRIDVVKQAIGDRIPVRQFTVFSKAAWVHAGAVAGGSMAAALLGSFVMHSLARAVPLVGLFAVAAFFIRRQNSVAAMARKCAAAGDFYRKATKGSDIINILPMLTPDAQALFLVGLDAEFRRSAVDKFPSLKSMCDQIDSFRSSDPESLDRTNALTNIPKTGLGMYVVQALSM